MPVLLSYSAVKGLALPLFTIQKMVKDWQARNPVESERVENLPLKADMPDSLKTVWHQVRELAHSELEVQRESLRKAEDDINLKIAELQEFSDNQTNTIEVLREQLAEVLFKQCYLANHCRASAYKLT